MTENEPLPGLVNRGYIAKLLNITPQAVSNLHLQDPAFPTPATIRPALYRKDDADEYAIHRGATMRRRRKPHNPTPEQELVGYQYIADQLHLKVETVRQYARGKKPTAGSGTAPRDPSFPEPVNPGKRPPLWRKADADAWVSARKLRRRLPRQTNPAE